MLGVETDLYLGRDSYFCCGGHLFLLGVETDLYWGRGSYFCCGGDLF